MSVSRTGFLWGVATAAYQIEGAAHEDGKGPSLWDVFSHIPGKIRDGSNADVACDHYHRWQSDLDLLTELGVNAYRFSISWPRVLPEGTGRVNQPGVDFYSRLVDGILERGITPLVTLWHADQPQALEEKGGWANREWSEGYGTGRSCTGAVRRSRPKPPSLPLMARSRPPTPRSARVGTGSAPRPRAA